LKNIFLLATIASSLSATPVLSQDCGTVLECTQQALEGLQSAQIVIERQQQQIDMLRADLAAESAARAAPIQTFDVNGICFRPRKLTRCFGGAGDHMTWVDNAGECQGAGYTVEADIDVLMQC